MFNDNLTFKGIHGTIKFIAAQAPINQTVYDFLRMLCENRVKAIVMLSKFDEDPPKVVS